MTKTDIINRLNEISLEIEDLQMDLRDSNERRWTEKDVADAKAFKQLMPDAVYVRRNGIDLEFLDRDESIIDDGINITNALPQLKNTQSARLDNIIGGAEYE